MSHQGREGRRGRERGREGGREGEGEGGREGGRGGGREGGREEGGREGGRGGGREGGREGKREEEREEGSTHTLELKSLLILCSVAMLTLFLIGPTTRVQTRVVSVVYPMRGGSPCQDHPWTRPGE